MAESYSPPEATNANMNFDIGGYTPKNPLDADFDFVLGVYYVLAGFSNIFTAIWADPNAGRDNGKLYALSWGPGAALTVLDLSDRSVYDHYTQDFAGRAQETLTDNDTRDLNA